MQVPVATGVALGLVCGFAHKWAPLARSRSLISHSTLKKFTNSKQNFVVGGSLSVGLGLIPYYWQLGNGTYQAMLKMGWDQDDLMFYLGEGQPTQAEMMKAASL